MTNHVLSTEEIFRKIKKYHVDALQDCQRLQGLFLDYSRGKLKKEKNQLDTFLDCQGNTRILNLSGASNQKQQTEYAQLFWEMTELHSMKEEDADSFITAFWRAVLGTEPPTTNPVLIPEKRTSQEFSIPSEITFPQPMRRPSKKKDFVDKPKHVRWLVLAMSYFGVALASFVAFLMASGLPLGAVAGLITHGGNSITENWPFFLVFSAFGTFMAVRLVKHVFRTSPENSMRTGSTDVAKRKRNGFAWVGGYVMTYLLVMLIMSIT